MALSEFELSLDLIGFLREQLSKLSKIWWFVAFQSSYVSNISMKQSRNSNKKLDNIDERIIQALSRSPDLSNKSMARQLGVSEATIANRIQSMEAGKIMCVVPQRNMLSDGYTLICLAFVEVRGTKMTDIAAKLAAIEEVITVSMIFDRSDFFVTFRVKDTDHLNKLITQDFASLPEVKCIRTDTCLQIEKLISGLGDLSAGLSPFARPNNISKKDDKIISLLLQDGRMSNREIARRLDVSEGNVRMRTKKMREADLFRIGVVRDIDSVGKQASAIARILTVPSGVGRLTKQLKELEMVSFLSTMSGEYNVVAVLHGISQQEISLFCQENIRSRPKVLELDLIPIISNTNHRFDLTYFD